MSRTLETDARPGLTGFQLKWIALVAMVIDHGASLFLSQASSPPLVLLYWTLRGIGRLAFPLYCFLLTEGFIYTRSRRRYLCRLGIFALVSELPFNLLCDNQLLSPTAQNVFFMLLLGLAALLCVERFQGKPVLWVPLVILIAGVSELLYTDYGCTGVVLVVIFYVLRSQPSWAYTLSACLWLILGNFLNYMIYYERSGARSLGYPPRQYLLDLRPYIALNLASLIALVFIRNYNGARGRSLPKYFFYAAYPAHMLILLLIAACLGK